ncbi:branched-chain amino acid ABC transporter permease [Halovivax gelatinilyticus]|uniref:branched-chain amino acid ABC transporter permease n=1 Tax=Halovivax gelatinilyticus TaxID=2961597 RepID=UPI0020CA7AD0|nr:branched-chain amino acid ABC transporter permease [Halovivax gelatinilyticus]
MSEDEPRDETNGAESTSDEPTGFRDRFAQLPRWQADLAVIVGSLLAVYAFIIALGMIAGLGTSGVMRTLRTVTFLGASYALVVLALNLHWGYTGLFNIGVAGFMAVGAYVMAIAVSDPDPGFGPAGLGLPMPVAIVLGVVAAGLVGLIVVLPALRIRADYFAIVTLAFAEVIRLLVTSGALAEFSVLGRELGTGGGSGISFTRLEAFVPEWVLYQGGDPSQGTNVLGYQILTITNSLGIGRTTVENWIYTLTLVLLVVLIFWLMVRTGNSPFGRVLKAIREDELATKSLGKNTNLVKVKVFVLGCAIMGLAGIMWQGRNGYVDPNAFLPIVTFYIFIALIIGGSGSNTGSVVGAFVFVGLLFEGPPYVQRIVRQNVSLPSPNTVYEAFGAGDPLYIVGYVIGELPNLRFVLFGIILILLMIYRPDGLLGHRNEPASPLDLRREQSPNATMDARGTAGGEGDE